MIGIGLGIGVGFNRPAGGAAPAPFRIVPVSATSAFVIAPHDDLGAVAYELTFGNAADNTTPGSSIGTPFGGWRWTGTHHLASVADDPTDPIGSLHDDIGSTDSAMQANFGSSLFGGHFHGGIVLSASDVPDLTSERYVSSFSFGYDATITWPTGETATVAYELAIQPDGNLAGSMSYASTGVFTRAFLSMLIGNGFTHHSTDGENFTASAAAGTYALGSNADIILRQGSTGYEIAVTSDQGGLTNLTNEIVSDGVRLKHYVRKTSAGSALGTVSMSRTIAFRQTAPDPEPSFDPITDTFDGTGSTPAGYTAVNVGSTYTSTLVGGVWQLRAGAAPTGHQKHVRPISGAKADGATVYQLEIDYASVAANTGAIVYVSKNPVGSTSVDLIPITGGSNSTSLNLSSSTATTATITFTVPEGTAAPHVLFHTSGLAGRGVNITEMRITEL